MIAIHMEVTDPIATKFDGCKVTTKQQLIFARAIILKPRVILIDEPSLGLAPAIVEQAFQHIENIAKTGVSILLVEQNARRGLSSSNYGTVMDLGEIVFEKDLEHKVTPVYSVEGISLRGSLQLFFST